MLQFSLFSGLSAKFIQALFLIDPQSHYGDSPLTWECSSYDFLFQYSLTSNNDLERDTIEVWNLAQIWSIST